MQRTRIMIQGNNSFVRWEASSSAQPCEKKRNCSKLSSSLQKSFSQKSHIATNNCFCRQTMSLLAQILKISKACWWNRMPNHLVNVQQVRFSRSAPEWLSWRKEIKNCPYTRSVEMKERIISRPKKSTSYWRKSKLLALPRLRKISWTLSAKCRPKILKRITRFRKTYPSTLRSWW